MSACGLAESCFKGISGASRRRVATPDKMGNLETYGLMGPLTLSKKSSILLVCFLMESRALVSSAGAGEPN